MSGAAVLAPSPSGSRIADAKSQKGGASSIALGVLIQASIRLAPTALLLTPLEHRSHRMAGHRRIPTRRAS